MNIKVFDAEIAPKGKAYLVLESGPAEGLPGLLCALRGRGARLVFLASKAEYPLSDGILDGVVLTHAHDMLGMTRALTPDRPRPQGRLILSPLAWEGKTPFLRIYNDSFFSVPNSATYGDEEFEQLMGPEYRCGFALLEGAPARACFTS